MISKDLFKSSAIYSLIGALPLASGVILLPFYTNLLPAAEFGNLALYISLSLLVQILVNFGLESYVTVYFIEYRHDEKQLKACMGTTLFFLLLLGAAFLLLSMSDGSYLFTLIAGGSLKFYPFGLLSVMTGICHSLTKTYTNLLIYQQRPIKFFWINIFHFVLVIGLSISGLYWFPNTLIGPIWGRFLSSFSVAIFAFVSMYYSFGVSFHSKFLKPMILYSYPIFLYFLLFWFASYIDRFIINHYMTSSDVAVYDVAMKCTLLIEFFQNGFSSAILPKLFSYWKTHPTLESDVEVNRLFSIFSFLSLLFVPLFVLFIPIIVPVFVKQPIYYQGFAYVPILSLSYIPRILFYMYLSPFIYFKKTVFLPRVFLVSVILQIALTIIFIKLWGLMGAVWAQFFSKPIQVVFLYLKSRSIYQFKYNKIKLLYLPITFMAVSILFEWGLKFQWPLLAICQIITSITVIFFGYRRELIPLAIQMIEKIDWRIIFIKRKNN